jgi:hypothetical protein
MKKIVVAMAAAALLPACTWVKLTSEGQRVRVAGAAEVAHCQKVGVTTSSTKNVVAGFERSDERVREELEFLARNAAADLQGDTIAPAGEPRDGRQTFGVYRCGP